MTYKSLGDQPRLGCCNKLEKFSVWIINFVLFVVGLAQIGAGAWAWKSDASDWTGTAVPKACVFMGLFLVFISFLGCCGAWKENRPMLWLYALLIFVLILGQVGALSIAAVSKDYSMRFMQEIWDDMDTNTRDQVEKTWKCCSFMGSAKHATEYSERDHEEYETCSAAHKDDGWGNPIPSCWDAAHLEVEHNLKAVVIAVAIVGGVQIVILFMTMCLITGIAKKSGAKKEHNKIEQESQYNGGHYPNI